MRIAPLHVLLLLAGTGVLANFGCSSSQANFSAVAQGGTAPSSVGGASDGGGADNVAAAGNASGNAGSINVGGTTAAASGGASGAASAGGGGNAGSAGNAGTTSTPFTPPAPLDCKSWPTAGATLELSATMEVSGVFDGAMKRYVGAGALAVDSQAEDLPPMIRLAPGSVLKNVVIGKPAADGIHCTGTCYLQNVWWEDVGEDAATFEGSNASETMTIECAGAKHAADKIFQHNGPGTMILNQIYISDFGKLYRSCGNCLAQYERHAQLTGIHADGGDVLVGVNGNYGDSAEFHDITAAGGIDICYVYKGNDTGAEPSKVSSGSDVTHCLYQSSDIHRP